MFKSYHNSTIPLSLAKKLEKKGFPVKFITCLDSMNFVFVCKPKTTFAEVFDMFMNIGVHIAVVKGAVKNRPGTVLIPVVNNEMPKTIMGNEDWYDCAIMAIDHALSEIKIQKI